MSINRIKIIAIIVLTLPLLAVLLLRAVPTHAVGSPLSVPDVAADYKAKCAVCHGPTATKFFDLAKSDDEHVQIILKGKKGEKPPFMPGFEAKGMTAEEAKGLVVYMRSLKK